MGTLKPTRLDSEWASLMALCETEASLKMLGRHPKLLKLVRSGIRELAEKMGFSERQIRTREFRAERERGHIVRIVVD